MKKTSDQNVRIYFNVQQQEKGKRQLKDWYVAT